MKLTRKIFLEVKLKFLELQIWNLSQQVKSDYSKYEKLNELHDIYDNLKKYLNE
tara:strand:+ start:1675 stop:1836 length:162 start_codon:yes stop_codon:yes gene_type:complete